MRVLQGRRSEPTTNQARGQGPGRRDARQSCHPQFTQGPGSVTLANRLPHPDSMLSPKPKPLVLGTWAKLPCVTLALSLFHTLIMWPHTQGYGGQRRAVVIYGDSLPV